MLFVSGKNSLLATAVGGGTMPSTDEFSSSTTYPVADNTPPTIELIGPSLINVPIGEIFYDPGVKAFDDVDGDLSNSVVVTGEVDTSIEGEYRIRYAVHDASFNWADIDRLVIVENSSAITSSSTSNITDTTQPTITSVFPHYPAVDETITVEGVNFINVNSVILVDVNVKGGMDYPTSFTNVDESKIFVHQPSNLPEGTFSILVNTNNGTALMESAFEVIRYVPPENIPTPTSVVPYNVFPGDVVTVYGSHFSDVVKANLIDGQVKGGMDYPVTFTRKSDGEVSIRIPIDLPPNKYDLMLESSLGGAPLYDAIVVSSTTATSELPPPPIIHSINPEIAKVGDTVAIYGENFSTHSYLDIVDEDWTWSFFEISDTRAKFTVVSGFSIGDHYIRIKEKLAEERYQSNAVKLTVEGADDTTGFNSAPSITEEDKILPHIKISGLNPVYIELGSEYIDEGATAYDDVDGDLTADIDVYNRVNEGATGQYYVAYKVSDSSGNTISVKRIVYVRKGEPLIATTTDSVISPTTGEKTETSPTIDEPGTIDSTVSDIQTTDPVPTKPKEEYVEDNKEPLFEGDSNTRSTDTIPDESSENIKTEERLNDFGDTGGEKEERVAEDFADVFVVRTEKDFDTVYEEENEEIVEAIKVLKAEVVKEERLFEKREEKSFRNDSDKDGISDYDEVAIFKTNPFNKKTKEGDKTDSEKILAGINPVTDELISYEDPREAKPPVIKKYRVEKLEVRGVTPTTAPEEVSKSELVFEGEGLPNSFVTIYIFSTPIIVTVKTDGNGRWTYALDKELDDGQHEMYVATVDNSGKIVAKSEPIPFVKTANAAELGTSLATAEETGEGLAGTKYLIFMISAAIAGVLLMILLVGSDIRRARLEKVTLGENVNNDNRET
jgi:hypothetical protein